MNLVLDTSAWYAFLLATDTHHAKAKDIIAQKPRLIIPFPVLEELAALLHHRQGKQFTSTQLSALVTAAETEVFFIDTHNHEAIWRLYTESPDYLDYVDCSVIWSARTLSLPVFAFDKHFKNLDISLI